MKSYSKEGIRRWIKIGVYKRRKFGRLAVSKEKGSYAPGGSSSDS